MTGKEFVAFIFFIVAIAMLAVILEGTLDEVAKFKFTIERISR